MYMMKNKSTIVFVYLFKQKVKEYYQNATDIGPIIGLHYRIQTIIIDIEAKYSNTTDGWNIDSKKCMVCKKHVHLLLHRVLADS